MTDQEFIKKLNQFVIKENLSLYNSILTETSRETVSDDYWKNTLNLYDSLGTENRQGLLTIMHQVQIDTLSNLLGIIDGTTFLTDEEGDFQLKFGDNELSGLLQDLFLASHEL